MIKNTFLFCTTFSFLFNTTSALAAQSLSTKIHNQYISLRAMGMGNAFTTISDDYSAMMYNPAALAKKKRGEIQFTVAGAGIATNTLKFAKDIGDAEESSTDENAQAAAISTVLDEYYGKPLGARIQAVELFWVRPSWGIALIPLDLSIDMSVHRQLGPSLDLNIKKDSTAAFGYGKEIMNDLAVGATAKFIHRDVVEQTVSALELAADSDVLSSDRFKEGKTIDLDIGVLWTPDWFSGGRVAKASTKTEDKVANDAAAVSAENSAAAAAVSADGKPVAPDAEKPAVPDAQNNEVKNDKLVDGEKKPEDLKKKKKKLNREVQSEIQAEIDAMAAEASSTDITQSANPAADAAAATPVDAALDVKLDGSVVSGDASKAVPSIVEKTQPTVDGKPVEKSADKKTEVVETKKDESLEERKIRPLAFSLVMRNALASSYSLSKAVNKDAVEAPDKHDRVIDLGASYNLVNWEDFKIKVAVEGKNLLHPNTTVSKSTHAGLEVDYSPGTWFEAQFRAGINQMYFTAGATLLLGIFEIDVVTYGEEVGTTNTKVENRVYAGKLGMNF